MGKADAGTKEFWRNNERFADLFNAVIFNGEPIIRPEDLTEIFSLERDIKLHPVITIVLYYGEEPWDGPKSLHEMLIPTPEKMLRMIPDYPINLIEIRKGERLIFHNPEVKQVFWALPRIYQGKIEELEGVMVRKEAAELIGAVTGSKTLINMAKRRKKGEDMELCNSLKRLAEEHEKIGEVRGESRGIILIPRKYRAPNASLYKTQNTE